MLVYLLAAAAALSACTSPPAASLAAQDRMTMTTPVDPKLKSLIAPTGRLRAAINLGNPILANETPGSGKPVGVSIDLAHELGRRLGVEVDLTVVKTAGKSVELATAEQVDVGFFAVDPVRGAGIGFSPPYVLIEGAYLVPADSPIRANGDVDRPGVRVVVGTGSAYDLYLTRELKSAQLVRAASSQAVVDTFVAQKLDVAAGVRQQLEADARRHTGVRMLPERFMVIAQAMGLPKNRDAAAHRYLEQFVEEMKASGFVAAALKRHGIEGASVAPAGR